jgi:Flp pilus assembly pilin Flp
MLNLLNKLRREKKGQDLVEYALLISLIAVACLTAVETLGDQVVAAFGKIVF